MISLCPAARDDQATLENLLQLYAYDFSERGTVAIDDDGRFADYPLDGYWVDAWRHPFLLRVDGKLAGFVLIAARSRLTGADGVFDMAEFFVLRGFRRKGVGLAAAFAAFDRFAGRWEVRQRATNAPATAFWRHAIGRYTDGKYDETIWSGDTWSGPVQTFSSVDPRR
jgi:predicted acetyltransferase